VPPLHRLRPLFSSPGSTLRPPFLYSFMVASATASHPLGTPCCGRKSHEEPACEKRRGLGRGTGQEDTVGRIRERTART